MKRAQNLMIGQRVAASRRCFFLTSVREEKEQKTTVRRVLLVSSHGFCCGRLICKRGMRRTVDPVQVAGRPSHEIHQAGPYPLSPETRFGAGRWCTGTFDPAACSRCLPRRPGRLLTKTTRKKSGSVDARSGRCGCGLYGESRCRHLKL